MHPKSCYALFLLALVACQAAPPQPEIIEKKSISEETSKVSKDLKLEDHGVDKDRAKKSATFCVEIHSNQQVPCKENQPSVVQTVQPVSFKEVVQPVPQPIRVLRPHVPPPPPQAIHWVQPETPPPSPQAIHWIQQEAPALPPQTIHLVQSETSPPPPQTIHVFKTETPTPPPQTIHVIQPQKPVLTPTPKPQPASINVESLLQPSPAAHTTNIILPAPHPQPAPQPANIVLPPPQPVQPVLQPLNFYAPQPQAAPPQQLPIVNILPAPASGCNQHLTVQPQSLPQPPKVIHQETKTESMKIHEEVKPAPKLESENLPAPSQIIEILPSENTLCQQELLVQPRPVVLIEQPRPLQLATLNQCNRPHHLVTGCTCPQSLAYKSKGSHATSQSWPRTHSKIHEHHVMLYPAAPAMPPMMPLMTKTPCSLMSLNENPSPIIFTPQAAQPGSRYGDTMISVHAGENSHPAYPSAYSHPMSYDSRPPNVPTVTVNTYPSLGGPIYRQAQSTDSQQRTLSMNEGQNNLVASEITNLSKDLNNQKRDAAPTQFKENEQTDFTEVEETKQEQK